MEKICENVKKIYLVGGIGATGKTEFSEGMALSLNCKVIRCDNVYCTVARRLNCPRDKWIYLPMTTTWNEYGSGMDDIVKLSYLDNIGESLPSTLIIEGESMFWNDREMAVIKDIFKNYEFRHFFINISYEQWLKNRSKRVGKPLEHIPPFMDEDKYKEITGLYREMMPDGYFEITDTIKQIDCSLTVVLNIRQKNTANQNGRYLVFQKT